ncbi:MAG TPA: DUF2975 domain-containing protein [Parvularculaceae bacterium]|nr:DUF2975 domain-containing protein [Amphiplicatus sp.]HOP21264.1 DUF2975 domain-containing protein [Amphiplicatus sp.]HPE31273.1 DUF2975 domain-containing protein [Parvularculaceae bacterium]HRX39376.1 DUF2975 domain-containing protein [Parvularculaceae bacterium]
MRAIGKGSLASILAAGLHAVRIVIFIAFFGLSIAAVIMPFLPMLERVSDGIVSIDGGTVSGGDYVKLMSYFVSFGVMLFIVNRLLEILKTLRFGSPFVRENAVRFRQVGYALLLGEGAKIAFGILGAIFDAELKGGTELTTWIAIVAVFVLAEVFLEGAKMKEEQDLTV